MKLTISLTLISLILSCNIGIKSSRQDCYTITSGKVGDVGIGTDIMNLKIKFPLELVKSEQIRYTEEGDSKEPIYILSESGKELYKITCRFNLEKQRWEDKIGEINITNSIFSTEQKISTSKTIKLFVDNYPDAEFYYSYVSDRFWCSTKKLDKVQFELEPTAYTGERDSLNDNELVKLDLKKFNWNAKIIRIRLY